jgi:hypothetical protein
MIDFARFIARQAFAKGCHHKLAEHRFGHSGLARRGRMAGDAILALKTELRSVNGTKRRCQSLGWMSAFGGKADMKRTWRDIRF